MTGLLWVFAALASPDVVMVGNSYTSVNDLDGLVAIALAHVVDAGTEPRTRRLARGGWRWTDHVSALSSEPAWQDALISPVDPLSFAVLQEQSQIPGFPDGSPDRVTSEAAAAELNTTAQAAGAATVLYATWGRRDGDPGNQARYPDFHTMNDLLDAGYRATAEAVATPTRPVHVAPVGRAFAAVHDADLEAGLDPLDGASTFSRLYQGDGSHPSVGGSWLAACTIVATLTGRAPGGEVPGLDPEIADQLAAIGASVVLDHPFEDLSFPWALSWASWEVHAEDPTVVDASWWSPHVRIDGPAAPAALTIGGRLELVEGGMLTLPADVEGVVEQAGGTLDPVDDATIVGDLIVTGGVLVLDSSELTVDGTADLRGASSIEMTAYATDTPVLTARTLLLDAVPADAELRTEGDWTSLVAIGAGGAGGDPVAECGCAVGGPPWWALLTLLLVRRREPEGREDLERR